MLKYIKIISLICFLAWPSQSLSIALPIRGRVPIHSKAKSLDALVRLHAQKILDLKAANKINLTPTRQNYLLKMSKDSLALSKSLKKISKFTIGDKIIYPSKGLYVLLEKELEKYMVPRSFEPIEVLYALTQDFIQAAQDQAYKDLRLKEDLYEPLAKSERQSAVIIIGPQDQHNLKVTLKSRVILFDPWDSSKKPIDLITQSTLYFNLIKNNINFLLSYSINGQVFKKVRYFW